MFRVGTRQTKYVEFCIFQRHLDTRLILWPSQGLKKWEFKCLLACHWPWVSPSPNAKGHKPEFDSPCAWGRWCFAMEPWGWGYHPDWQVQLDTCRNSLSEVWIDQLSINSLGFCVNLDWLLRVLAPQIWYYLFIVNYYSLFKVCI